MESEKLTIGLGPVDLGKVDLLVSQGLYSSRTDLIRSAVRRLLDEHERIVQEAAVRQELTVGVVHYDRASLELVRKRGERIRAKVLGYLKIAEDVSPELADACLDEVRVHGVLKASPAVLERLGPKVIR